MEKQAGFGRSEDVFNPMAKPKLEATYKISLSNLNLGKDLEGFSLIKNDLDAFSTPAANNIARGEALDINIRESEVPARLLIYPKSEQDDKIYQLFNDYKIPQFTRFTMHNNPDLTILMIPESAYRLDSIVLTEQENTLQGYTGALEIMNNLGELLNKMRKVSGMLPQNFQICEVAMIIGEKDFIKLIPPYVFSENVQINQLINKVEAQLSSLDPDHSHITQLKEFSKALYRKI